MNSFPFDSWEEGIEALGPYFTWADSEGVSVLLAILGIAVSVVAALLVTVREDKLLNHAADRLADKYASED